MSASNPDQTRGAAASNAAGEGAPVAPPARIATLDVVRGVALLGILLVNVHLFRGFDVGGLLEGEVERAHGALDRGVEVLTGLFATGTFLGLFSLLFGLGIALQFSRGRGGRIGTARLLIFQRMLWLLAIGYAHRQFASVDILVGYSILGLILVLAAGPFVPPRPAWTRTLAGVGLVLLVGVGPMAANVGGPELGEGLFRERSEAVQEGLTAGGAGERVEIRALEAVGSQGGRAFTIQILGWMLIGFGLGSSRRALEVFRNPSGRFLALGVVALAVGAAFRAAMAFPVMDASPFRSPDGVGGLLGVLGSALLVTGLGMTVAGLAARAQGAGRPFGRLAGVGRMALSAYLLQSVLVEGAFLVPGAAEALGSAGSLLLVLAVWLALLAVCPWWMARFRFGPVEWLWRSLTYLRVQPLRPTS